MKKLVVSIMDRLAVEALYPREGSIDTQILVRDLRGKLKLTAEDLEAISLKVAANGSIAWQDKDEDGNPISKAQDKEVEITNGQLALLKRRAEELHKEEKITSDLLELALKLRELNVDIKKEDE